MQSQASLDKTQPTDNGQPTGTVTLGFTDIEGSTGLLQALGDRYPEVLAEHHRLIREAFARHGAVERGSAGDGLYFVFPAVRGAVQAALGTVKSRLHRGLAGLRDQFASMSAQ